jgi:hypothetical protein
MASTHNKEKQEMTRRKHEPLVRYVSPFGSPAWMTRAEAEKYLAEDDARWLRAQEIGALSEHERAIGPPRIEVVK